MSKRNEREPELAVNYLPVSNGEVWPVPAMPGHRLLMQVQARIGEEARKRLGMSRRDFVRSAAGLAAGFAAAAELGVSGRAFASHIDPCDADPSLQLDNLPGEFIFDIQTHMMEVPDGLPHPPPFRGDELTAEFFNQTVCGFSGDGYQNLLLGGDVCSDRVDYIRMVHLESPTNAACISAFPSHGSAPDDPDPVDFTLLPSGDASCTCDVINDLAKSRRSVFHHFVMPNRERGGSLASELDLMEEVASTYGDNLGGWKIYPLFGDSFTLDADLQLQLGTTPGFLLSGAKGRRAVELVRRLGNRPLCVHKGVMFANFQSAYGGCWDVGQIAKDFPSTRLMVYHSGWYQGSPPSNSPMDVDGDDGRLVTVPGGFEGGSWFRTYTVDPKVDGYDPVEVVAGVVPIPGSKDPLGRQQYLEIPGPYPLAEEHRLNALNTTSGTDGLIKAVREAGWAGGEWGTHGFGNHPTVYAELGFVWIYTSMFLMGFTGLPGHELLPGVQAQCAAAHLLGKFIRHLGPRRVVWGTDSPWFGSPMHQIARLRRFPEPWEVYAKHILVNDYGLPFGLDGDVDDPTSLPSDPSNSIRNAIFGRNAADAYGLTVGPRNAIACEDVGWAAAECDDLASLRRDGFTRDPGTARELRATADNRVPGYRSVGRMVADLLKGGSH